ncbi:hypothetical protein V1273_003713 [Bradyrhizobium sp. AZCC 1721]
MSLRETADGYPHIVVVLNPNWRVIRCPDGLQWILQRRGSPERARANDWRGRSYYRTRDALIRCAREYSGAVDPTAFAVLAALPTRIEAASSQRAVAPSECSALASPNFTDESERFFLRRV